MKKWLILALLPFTANAALVNLTWTNATLNTDGTDIALTGEGSLVSTALYWSVCDPNDEVIITPGLELTVPTTIPGNAESTDIDVGTPGRWCFIAKHINLEGEESDFSNVAIKDVFVVPEPPIGLTVVPTDLIAYSVSQTNDRFVLIPQGTVPEGTPCDGTMSANGHYLVPRDTVQWAGTSRPPVVFALCQ